LPFDQFFGAYSNGIPSGKYRETIKIPMEIYNFIFCGRFMINDTVDEL